MSRSNVVKASPFLVASLVLAAVSPSVGCSGRISLGGEIDGGSSGSGPESSSSGGTDTGASCSAVTSCGGNVVGTWTATSSCLNVTGQADLSPLGVGCTSAPVTGSLWVTGTWSANSDGTYSDNTTTSGNEQLELPASCLNITGTPVTCDGIAEAIPSLGYAAATCTTAAGGGCACSATVQQTGGIAFVSASAPTSGTSMTSGDVITTSDGTKYSYCVSGTTMTLTPEGTAPTVTGTVMLQKSGSSGSSGDSGSSGSSSSAGDSGGSITPCDVLAAGGNPCVAAHSTTRLVYGGYTGPLYQVCNGPVLSGGPDYCTSGTTMDIRTVAGGYADYAAQDAFCAGGSCTISIIYDQSPNHNDLKPTPAGGGAKTSANDPAIANALPTTLNGHKGYGVLITPGIGYRILHGVGTATGDQPETEYMVTGQNKLTDGCCFDYGNAETDAHDDGNGASEAVYFGGGVAWGTGFPGGHQNGPWVMADLENGLYAGWQNGQSQDQAIPTNTPLHFDFVTAVVVGDTSDQNGGMGRFALYGGDATTGTLTAMYDGIRPAKPGYVPMAKQGSVILGTAGDNSDSDGGEWYEGVMTSGAATTATLNNLQANIVAAGYGK